MKIVYYSNNWVEWAFVAANIHLNKLPAQIIPSTKEILAAIHENSFQDIGRLGIPYFFGLDDLQNEIYLLNLGSQFRLGLQTIFHTVNTTANPLEWHFFDTVPLAGASRKVGYWITRKLGLVQTERTWIARGIQTHYSKMLELVRYAKELEQIGKA